MESRHRVMARLQSWRAELARVNTGHPSMFDVASCEHSIRALERQLGMPAAPAGKETT